MAGVLETLLVDQGGGRSREGWREEPENDGSTSAASAPPTALDAPQPATHTQQANADAYSVPTSEIGRAHV